MSCSNYVIRNTKSPRLLLQVLRDTYYRDLPLAVWNRRLWFYRDLLPLLNEAVTGDERSGVSMEICESNGRIIGVAFTETKHNNTVARICAIDRPACYELLNTIVRRTNNNLIAEIGVVDRAKEKESEFSDIGE